MCAVRVTTGQGRSTIPARVLWSTNRRTAQCRSAVHVREVRLLVLHVVRQRIRFVYRVVWASTSLGDVRGVPRDVWERGVRVRELRGGGRLWVHCV